MDFFENLKEKVTQTTKVVAKKSNELVEVTKLKIEATDTEHEIEKRLRDIGEVLYEAHKTEGDPDNSLRSLEEQCEEIDKLYEKIESLNDRIAELKNEKVCPNCQKAMDKDALFCSGCGARFD